MHPKKQILLITVIFLLVAAGIIFLQERESSETSSPQNTEFTRIKYEELPEKVRKWVDNSKPLQLAQEKHHGDRRYILATYGEKPTGGYSVEITDLKSREEHIEVLVNFSEPDPGQFVTQAITYPFDIVYTEPSDVPLKFSPQGDENYIPSLIGIEEVPPIKASSDWIKIFAPEPDEQVSRDLEISGVANVFEGNIQYRLLDQNGNKEKEGFTTAGMGDWYYFDLKLEVPDSFEDKDLVILELFTTSAKDGREENLVSIPLIFRL